MDPLNPLSPSWAAMCHYSMEGRRVFKWYVNFYTYCTVIAVDLLRSVSGEKRIVLDGLLGDWTGAINSHVTLLKIDLPFRFSHLEG
jgi:hypothetical protein